MKPRPWSRLSLAGPLGQVLRLVAFTLGVSLVVLGSAVLIRATIALTRSYTGSSGASSLLALVVFAGSIAVPAYLLAIRIDHHESTDDDRDADRDREKL